MPEERRKARPARWEVPAASAVHPREAAGIPEGWGALAERRKLARRVAQVVEEALPAEEGLAEQPVAEVGLLGGPLAAVGPREAGRRMAECPDRERRATAAPFQPLFRDEFAGLAAWI